MNRRSWKWMWLLKSRTLTPLKTDYHVSSNCSVDCWHQSILLPSSYYRNLLSKKTNTRARAQSIGYWTKQFSRNLLVRFRKRICKKHQRKCSAFIYTWRTQWCRSSPTSTLMVNSRKSRTLYLTKASLSQVIWATHSSWCNTKRSWSKTHSRKRAHSPEWRQRRQVIQPLNHLIKQKKRTKKLRKRLKKKLNNEMNQLKKKRKKRSHHLQRKKDQRREILVKSKMKHLKTWTIN